MPSVTLSWVEYQREGVWNVGHQPGVCVAAGVCQTMRGLYGWISRCKRARRDRVLRGQNAPQPSEPQTRASGMVAKTRGCLGARRAHMLSTCEGLETCV